MEELQILHFLKKWGIYEYGEKWYLHRCMFRCYVEQEIWASFFDVSA